MKRYLVTDSAGKHVRYWTLRGAMAYLPFCAAHAQILDTWRCRIVAVRRQQGAYTITATGYQPSKQLMDHYGD